MGNLNISDPVLKNKISEITTIGKKYALNEGIPPQELKIDCDFTILEKISLDLDAIKIIYDIFITQRDIFLPCKIVQEA